MKKMTMFLAVMLLASSLTAVAAPVQMTDAEMDQVVAGEILYLWTNKGGNYVLNEENYFTGDGARDRKKDLNGSWSRVTGKYGIPVSCSTYLGMCTNGGTIEYNEASFEWNYIK